MGVKSTIRQSVDGFATGAVRTTVLLYGGFSSAGKLTLLSVALLATTHVVTRRVLLKCWTAVAVPLLLRWFEWLLSRLWHSVFVRVGQLSVVYEPVQDRYDVETTQQPHLLTPSTVMYQVSCRRLLAFMRPQCSSAVLSRGTKMRQVDLSSGALEYKARDFAMHRTHIRRLCALNGRRASI